jgi:hypothetical protein
MLKYNFLPHDPMEVEDAKITMRIKINTDEDTALNMDDFTICDKKEKLDRFDLLLCRFKKILLVKSKALNPPINIRKEDYREILKYI